MVKWLEVSNYAQCGCEQVDSWIEFNSFVAFIVILTCLSKWINSLHAQAHSFYNSSPSHVCMCLKVFSLRYNFAAIYVIQQKGIISLSIFDMWIGVCVCLWVFTYFMNFIPFSQRVIFHLFTYTKIEFIWSFCYSADVLHQSD